jgi:DNA-binding transcriptional ArsR family regulator
MFAEHTPSGEPSPYRVAKALTHPTRAKVLEILDRRVASPAEISNQLGVGVSHISYHVKVLKELECVELVAKHKRRGAIEHRYRAVARPYFSDRAWAHVSHTSRQGISDALLKAIGDEATAALAAGTLAARHDSHLSRTRLVLDQAGWRKVTDLLEKTLHLILAIQEESSGRLAQGAASQIDTRLAILHFEMPGELPQPPGPDLTPTGVLRPPPDSVRLNRRPTGTRPPSN